MKGPGIRIDLDVRRIWTCPTCGAIRKTGGEIGAVRCQCADEAWMLLQEPPRRRDLIPPPKSIMAEMSPADLLDQPEPAPATTVPEVVVEQVVVEVVQAVVIITQDTRETVVDEPVAEEPQKLAE